MGLFSYFRGVQYDGEGFFGRLENLPRAKNKGSQTQVSYPFGSLTVGLVNFGVGTWRELSDMDIENAINTFCIMYINRYNENLAYESNKK